MSIGQIGLLRPDEVIFYHPLDSDLREHTTTEIWDGTASFVAGKVGPALSAITSSNIDLGGIGITVVGSGVSNDFNPNNIAALSSTLVVATWSDNTLDKSFVKAGTVVGTGITWGTAVQYNPDFDPGTGRQGEVVRLDATRFAIAWATVTSGLGGYMTIGSVSGTTVTLGLPQQYESGAQNGEQRLEFLDTDKLALFWRSTDGKPKALVARVSGTDVFYGTPRTFSSVSQPTVTFSDNTMALAPLTSGKILACTSENSGAGEDTSRIGIISGPSGTDISWGDPVDIGTTTSKHIDLIKIDETTALLGKTGLNAAFTRVATIGGASGTTIAWSSEVLYKASTNIAEIDMELLSPSSVVMYYRDTGATTWVALGNVSGTTFTIGAETLVADITISGIDDFTELNVAKLTTTTFMLGMGNLDVVRPDLGSLNYSISSINVSAGISGTSAFYPSVSGDTRVALAMWANDLTKGGSTISIFRGYSIVMTSTTIALGGSTATWNAAGIATVMTTMNDGSDHLLVLDFENTSGTNWALNTSIDAAPFVSQGEQDTGTQIVATTDTNPRVVIADGFGIEQWIDELAMWAGDKTVFTQFTNTELENLFNVADVGGKTQDEFDDFVDSLTDVPGFSIQIVPDTFGTNLSRTPSKTFSVAQVVSVTPSGSGLSVSGIGSFFNKDLPVDIEIIGVQAIMRTITTADFNGTSGSVSLVVESSDEADVSPKVPFTTISLPTPVWDTLVTAVECKAIAVNGQCFNAPLDGTNVLDSSYVALPKWSSLRAVLTAQVEDSHVTADSLVEILVVVEFRPTTLKDQRYL